jgi:hypothetical protein
MEEEDPFDFDAPDTFCDLRKISSTKMRDIDEIWFRCKHPLISRSLESLDEIKTEKKRKSKKKKTLFKKKKINDENNNDDVMQLLKSHNRKVRGPKKVLGRKRTNLTKTKKNLGKKRINPTNTLNIKQRKTDQGEDLMALLQQHNKKFKSKHTYEPRVHSVRDVRKWEKKHGKKYCALNMQERTIANREISLMKR